MFGLKVAQIHKQHFRVDQGGGNRTVPDTIMGNCFHRCRPPTTAFTLNVGKCFWVEKVDTTAFNLNVGKCFLVNDYETTQNRKTLKSKHLLYIWRLCLGDIHAYLQEYYFWRKLRGLTQGL